MKQVELAEAIGVSEATISRILSGRRRPSWRIAKALARATHTDPIIWIDGRRDDMEDAIEDSENAKVK